jgi:crcB protein
MTNLLLVAFGGAIGASARHLVNMASMRLAGPTFPWGTLVVNLVGCLAMGILVEVIARRLEASGALRLFLATGVLGGFTTFSAFSLDFALLWERGAAGHALAYALASVLGSLAAVFLGLWLARQFA